MCTGFYSGAYLKLTNSFHKVKDNTPFYYTYFEYTENSIACGPIIGYQRYIKKKFVIDIIFGLGIGRVINTKIGKVVPTNLILEIVRPQTYPDGRLGLNIGYKF